MRCCQNGRVEFDVSPSVSRTDHRHGTGNAILEVAPKKAIVAFQHTLAARTLTVPTVPEEIGQTPTWAVYHRGPRADGSQVPTPLFPHFCDDA